MPQQSIMEQADLIMGGVLSNPSKASTVGNLGVSQEELPDVSPEQHEALMSHVLGEGKRMDAVKQKGREMVGRTKAYVTGKKGAYSWKNQKPGAKKERTLKGDLTSVKRKVGKAFAPLTDKQRKEIGLQDRHKYLTGGDVKPLPTPKEFTADKSGTVRTPDSYGVGQIKPLTLTKRAKAPVKKMKNENLTQSQMDILIQAKNIVAEMTSVGMVGTNMASNSSKTSHHPALLVKLPGDKDQAVQIKAASTPPVFKATVAKDPAPSGTKKTRVIVKRKSAHSKDDETQGRIHNDMKAMYHESFSNFVGELLTENIKESI